MRADHHDRAAQIEGERQSATRVLEILKNPDAVHQLSGRAGNLIFRKDNGIAVIYGPVPTQGQAQS